jgi:hypothetical protein
MLGWQEVIEANPQLSILFKCVRQASIGMTYIKEMSGVGARVRR